MRPTPWNVCSLVVLALTLVAAACSSDHGGAGPTDQHALQGSITVAAAASLHGVFTELGADFTRSHPATHVEFSFGSSGVLEAQLAQGAPADVFASADAEVMAHARRDDLLATAPVVFARNRLEMVTKPHNPGDIQSLDDLRRADVVALCALEAPCGAKAAEALRRAGVHLATAHITRAQDVKATLRQVTFGDAEAAIVYVTDARTVGDRATAVTIAPRHNVETDYPMAVVRGTHHEALARAWIDYVLGRAGARVLRRAGFAAPG